VHPPIIYNDLQDIPPMQYQLVLANKVTDGETTFLLTELTGQL